MSKLNSCSSVSRASQGPYTYFTKKINSDSLHLKNIQRGWLCVCLVTFVINILRQHVVHYCPQPTASSWTEVHDMGLISAGTLGNGVLILVYGGNAVPKLQSSWSGKCVPLFHDFMSHHFPTGIFNFIRPEIMKAKFMQRKSKVTKS